MSGLICKSRALAHDEIAIGLAAYSRSSSVPMMALAIATDLVSRVIRAQRIPANDNFQGEAS